MSTAPVVLPQRIERLERAAPLAAGIGLLLTALGAFFDPGQVFRSYLFGFLFWTNVAVGCLSISCIHHLTGGLWGLAIRRLLEAGMRTLPLLAILFLPVLLGLAFIYPWARADVMAADHLLQQKRLYLNAPFFVGRAVFYFLVWIGLSRALLRTSLALDEGADYLRTSRRLRALSGVGLVFMGLTITFSAVDWGMSLDPHWFSTVYGILFMVGQALSAMALVIVLLAALGAQEPLAVFVRGTTAVHDLGKLLFAFVMLWAYISFSQFLIIWSGNLPEEIPWYLHRLHGGWQWLALVLVALHFVVPFLLLLSRDLKRDPRRLALIAGGLLAARVADLYWLVGPDLHPAGRAWLRWMDLTALVGVGGVWLWAFGRQLHERPLLPLGEPEVREVLEAARG